ncbi:hypothetical protein BGZ65_006834 [Modicella reniformis]|uniref:Uncharacterized protein n=1 Tax=Modicella reniformis TaxID=1440133 RepID=A0A9P6SQ33_9FUNG|nr:hypothetical protein BGZ65_006834 [Modicella reniformis]
MQPSSHVQCTEAFYKSSVMDELKSNPTVMPEDRKRMLGILDRFEKQAIDQEQMMDMSEEKHLQKLHLQQQKQSQHQGTDELRNNTTVQGGSRKLTPKERDELIRKAIEEEEREANIDILASEGQKDEQMNPDDFEEMERILDQEHQDMISRFKDVDLDQESFESIWAKLNHEEQQEFREKFMISGRMDENSYEDQVGITREGTTVGTSIDVDEEESEAKTLLKEMEDTLKRGSTTADENSKPVLADLDTEDLRAIRSAEISELVPILRPWWETEAEVAGQLRRVVTSEDVMDNESARLCAANIKANDTNKLHKQTFTPSAIRGKFVLNEEVILRSHRALIQDVEETKKEFSASTSVPLMVRAPHPSLIYHVVALLFTYAATIRVLNGDLKEEPEQTLAYIFDLCPFFGPSTPSPASRSSLTNTTVETSQLPDVEDFETTLAHLQSRSLNSQLWKGDTLRPDMLSLLLQDLILIMTRLSRCLRSIRELKDVFLYCMNASSQKQRLYSKSVLHRLVKKLEFYESYLQSDEWMMRSDRLDQVKTEVIMIIMRVQREMEGWVKDLESVSKVQGVSPDSTATGGPRSAERILIEELPT